MQNEGILEGYKVKSKVIDSVSLGGPQNRERVYLIATKLDARIDFPRTTHGEGARRKPIVTQNEAISDLPKLKNEKIDPAPLPYGDAPQNDYQRTMRGNAEHVTDNDMPTLEPEIEKLITNIGADGLGGNWNDLPDDKKPQSLKDEKRDSAHSTRYGRRALDRPAATITTQEKVNGNACIHPTAHRLRTVRERMRLMGFPDSYQLSGTLAQRNTQVGNAMMPMVMKKIFDIIVKASKTKRTVKPKASNSNDDVEMMDVG